MDTIFTFASLTQALATVQGGLGTLGLRLTRRTAPRTALDDAHIDLLVASAHRDDCGSDCSEVHRIRPDSVPSGGRAVIL